MNKFGGHRDMVIYFVKDALVEGDIVLAFPPVHPS